MPLIIPNSKMGFGSRAKWFGFNYFWTHNCYELNTWKKSLPCLHHGFQNIFHAHWQPITHVSHWFNKVWNQRINKKIKLQIFIFKAMINMTCEKDTLLINILCRKWVWKLDEDFVDNYPNFSLNLVFTLLPHKINENHGKNMKMVL